MQMSWLLTIGLLASLSLASLLVVAESSGDESSYDEHESSPRDRCDYIRCGYGAICENGKCVCPTICTDIYKPVCGSDGRVYSNACRLRIASCQRRRHIYNRPLSYCQRADTLDEGLPYG